MFSILAWFYYEKSEENSVIYSTNAYKFKNLRQFGICLNVFIRISLHNELQEEPIM